jgi:hypothetical protein
MGTDLGGVMVPTMFETNKLVILAVSAIAAFALMFWLFDAGLVYSLVITVAYTLLALFVSYYKSKRSS